jgi:hypothetical protein
MCHYDLRGLPKDAAACPECGARITGKKAYLAAMVETPPPRPRIAVGCPGGGAA